MILFDHLRDAASAGRLHAPYGALTESQAYSVHTRYIESTSEEK